MKFLTNLSLVRNHNLKTLSITLGVLLMIGLACGGSSKPAPSEYVGFWTGADGTTITIRADGGADYKSSNTSISGGGLEIDEAGKTLKITFASLGPSFTIDKAPDGNQMTLSGVVYKKGGVAATLEMPAEPELQELAKATMKDFDGAVQSGDFTGFYKKLAKKFQDQSSPDKLKDAFKVFVDNKDDFDLKSVFTMKATFEPSPTFEPIGDEKALSLTGSYATSPKKLKFELKYFKEEGAWKLASIRINTADK
ncbi:MAG: hypothetical protein IPJ30_05760 [Acidobacteria bacterium]|nr:hypothetical protein [Acidobacteriota bacterium]